jgi:CheY-like chemotaxis protein
MNTPRAIAGAQDESGPSSRSDVHTKGDAGAFAGKSVLLVEDDEDAREILALLLEQAGAEVRQADSVTGALEALDRAVPDLVLCDISMPDADGYSFARALRARPAARGGQVVAVALTAHARDEDRRRSLEAGFSGHAVKPIDPDVLGALVRGLLSARAAATR